MKYLFLCLTLCGLLAITPGCKSTPESQTAQIATAAEIASFTGVSIDLESHPDHRPIYAAAVQTLNALANDGNFDPVAFAAALKDLPVRQLKDKRASILIQSTIILWNGYSQQIISADQKAKVGPILVSVRDGIQRALDGSAPVPPQPPVQ